MTGPFLAGVPIALGLTLAACGPAVGDGGETEAVDSSTGQGDSTGRVSASAESTAAPSTTSFTTASTDDGTTVTTGDDSNDGPVGFYGVPSDFNDQPFECDLDAQDCPPGEKCMPWANDGGDVWNATRCSPIDASPGQLGDECLVEGSAVSGVDNCDTGLTCFLIDELNAGTCVELCTEAQPGCSDGSDCAIVPTTPQVGFCVVPGLCDPLGTDCAAGEVCAPTVPTVYQCLPDASGPTGAYGDPCAAQNSCDATGLCVSEFDVPGCASDHCCTIFCDPAAGDLVCPANALGQTCVDLGAGVGACLVN
jgi:hypothetical protein